jgi:hypothetical protein
LNRSAIGFGTHGGVLPVPPPTVERGAIKRNNSWKP